MSIDPTSSAPSRAAEFRSAGIKIGGALIVFGALYALYAHEVQVEAQVQELLAGPKIAGGTRAGGARSDLNKDTPAGWLAAEKSLKAALALQPSNPFAVAAWADVEALLVSAGFEDRAAPADEGLARAEAKDIAQPERYEAHALRLLQQGKAGEAENYLLAVLGRFGAVPRAIDALGLAQRASGKLVEARQSFRKAQDADWRSARKVANYATALLEEGSAAEALASYDRALQANGDHLRSMLGKALAHAALARAGRNADLKAARSLTDGVLSRGADEVPPKLKAQAYAVRAEVRAAAGDAPGAAQDALEAQKLAPALAQVLRALALTAAERKADAYAAWKAATQADPYDASLYFDGVIALSAANDDGGAEKLLGGYAATLPKSARYHLALARLQLAKDDPKAAEAELARAQALEPANPLVYFEQGRAAQKRKDGKAATAAYEKAVQLRDDFPEVYRQMGVLYLENKAVTEGLRAFTDALARYKAARTPAPLMETFYEEVKTLVTKAGQAKLARQWVEEARAAH
jgi:tetratricopeptide (TPR) repeat protein